MAFTAIRLAVEYEPLPGDTVSPPILMDISKRPKISVKFATNSAFPDRDIPVVDRLASSNMYVESVGLLQWEKENPDLGWAESEYLPPY